MTFVEAPADHPLENLPDAEPAQASFAFSDEIVRAMNTISEDFKSIVLMADLQELSYKEIAQKLRIPIGTVMSRLFRGRKMLKKVLSAYAATIGY